MVLLSSMTSTRVGTRSPASDPISLTKRILQTSLQMPHLLSYQLSCQHDAPRRQRRHASYLHHLEIVLAGAAFGADPVHRHVFPGRARGDALFGQPRCLVVDPSTNQTHPGTG